MTRRDFLISSTAALATGTTGTWASDGPPAGPAPDAAREELTGYFLAILGGFLRHARATSADFTVCDFPEGTKIKGCCTPSGKTYVSVARMLPVLAEYLAAGQPRRVAGVDLEEVVRGIYRTAFDPQHPDYWGEPAGAKPTQRTVESALVAMALVRMGPDFVGGLSAQERRQVNRWLASCTVIPERTSNHAWFTAVNQAARLRLARSFPEFAGDERWMLDDLEAMEGLAANAADGWYSDDPKLTVFDYYNFWTFGNFPLFWSRIAGELYPTWAHRLGARTREFLRHAPCFFGADGAVPLFGRSLVYRWALLSPLLLGYQQGHWPHSPGLLRRIVRRNFAWWWRLGAFDETRGKLRETLTPAGTREVSENYIDNGHPYWAMQAFTFFAIPAADPFWTEPEEPLPVERGDFLVRIPGPKMILTGTKASGDVRWVQARGCPRRDYYRDKYNKFAASSGFPGNLLPAAKPYAPWDQSLVLRDRATGVCAARIFPDSGELLEDGVRTVWMTKFGGGDVRVISTIRLAGEFEYRSHRLVFEAGPAQAAVALAMEVVEGSYPLGLAVGAEAEKQAGPDWLALRSAAGGTLLVSWRLAGHDRIEVAGNFDPAHQANVNLVYPKVAVITLSRALDRAAGTGPLVCTSLHYASRRPAPMADIQRRARELMAIWS